MSSSMQRMNEIRFHKRVQTLEGRVAYLEQQLKQVLARLNKVEDSQSGHTVD